MTFASRAAPASRRVHSEGSSRRTTRASSSWRSSSIFKGSFESSRNQKKRIRHKKHKRRKKGRSQPFCAFCVFCGESSSLSHALIQKLWSWTKKSFLAVTRRITLRHSSSDNFSPDSAQLLLQ